MEDKDLNKTPLNDEEAKANENAQNESVKDAQKEIPNEELRLDEAPVDQTEEIAETSKVKDQEGVSEESSSEVNVSGKVIEDESSSEQEIVETSTESSNEDKTDKAPIDQTEEIVEALEVKDQEGVMGESSPEVVVSSRVNEDPKSSKQDSAETSTESAIEAKSDEVRVEVVESSNEDNNEGKENAIQESELPVVDLKQLGKEELVQRLSLIIEKGNVGAIKPEVEEIKKIVSQLYYNEVEEQKKSFLENKGEEKDFKPSGDHLYEKMNYLVNQYRAKRVEKAKLGELEKENNLRIKYEIIEEIKALVQSPESINKTFQHFHELQERWRNTGNVPRNKVKDLYENYHLHVEIFYDYIKINKDLRDYDLKKNLEKKAELCEKAEGLESETSEIKAFAELQELHKEWRETGPVPKEQKEVIWERFKAATSLINKKHQKYYDDLRGEQKLNLDKKAALCEKVEGIAEKKVSSPKDWNKLADEVLGIQKEWRTIGFAPKKSNNAIYERFRAACDLFFERKRQYYHEYKSLQDKNLAAKNALVEKAESMKDREDWREGTEDFIAIQKEWKKIGPVPRKYSDVIWKKFREACDAFFENKHAFFHKVDDKQEENLVAKKALIEKVQAFEMGEETKESIKILNGFKKEWTEIGHVPLKEKDAIYNAFRNAINVHFDKLDIDDSAREMMKFQSKIEELAQSNNSNKLYIERNKLVLKLRALESDVAVWGNNLGFFSNSKDSASLVKDFEHKIEQAKMRIRVISSKIKFIDKMDQ